MENIVSELRNTIFSMLQFDNPILAVFYIMNNYVQTFDPE